MKSGSLSGSVSLCRTSRRTGLPTTVTPASLRASGSLLASFRRTDTTTLPSAVAAKSSLTTYVSSIRSEVLLTSGVNTTRPEGSDTIVPAVVDGSDRRDRLEDERVTVGIDVVGEHVERRRAPLAGRGDVGVRLRRAVAGAVGRGDLDGDDRRGALAAPVGDRVAERDDAGEAGGGRDLHAASVGVDRDHGVAAGRVDLGDEQHVAVRVGVVGEHVDVDRAVDAGLGLVVAGDRRPVRTVLVDLVRLDDLGVRVVGVDLLDHLAALVLGVVLVGLVGGVGQDRAPVLDAVEAPLRAGDPGRPGVDVVDPHPAVDQPEAELGAGALERRGLDLLVAAPLGERRRRRRHGEQAAAEDDRRDRRAAGELADLGALDALAFAGGERDREDAAVRGRGDDVVGVRRPAAAGSTGPAGRRRR